MFDLGWAEIAFMCALALIVIGPKDLPAIAHGAGKIQGKIRRFYRDAMFSLKKLELEVEHLDRAPTQAGQPDYFNLLPEHIRNAMEMTEPRRDKEAVQQTEADYHTAMAEIHRQQALKAANHELATDHTLNSAAEPITVDQTNSIQTNSIQTNSIQTNSIQTNSIQTNAAQRISG